MSNKTETVSLASLLCGVENQGVCRCYEQDSSSANSVVSVNPQKALIFLHGFGQSGDRMKQIFSQVDSLFKDYALYFPDAPVRARRCGYQWFSLPLFNVKYSTKDDYQKMMTEALVCVKSIEELIENIHQTQKIPYQNIVVAGFSQGGLIAVLTGLLCHHPLPKVVSLSGVPVVFTDDFCAEMVNNKPNILLTQGTSDRILPSESMNLSKKTLGELGIVPTEARIEGLRHQIDVKALQKLADFV